MTSLMDAQMSAIHERDDSNYMLIPIDYKYDDQQVLQEQIRYSKQKDMSKTNYNQYENQQIVASSSMKGFVIENNAINIKQVSKQTAQFHSQKSGTQVADVR